MNPTAGDSLSFLHFYILSFSQRVENVVET